jgi:membrane-associated phospholipid phosphatase
LSAEAPPATVEPRPWRRALAWLAFLAPFFYATYGVANWLASRRADVGEIVFDWERQVPFLAWTILPYWTINAFYGLSLFVCTTRRELDTHGRRLLTAQILAVICFIAFPLRFSFARPTSDGWAGFMFEALASFDLPFNQAPSLHIALLVILWVLYARHLPRAWHWLLHSWFALIGVSVLTTYQHHFIDIPTGALLGFFCLWLWPNERDSPLDEIALSSDPKRRRLASIYAGGAVLAAIIAFALSGWALWLLWASVALAMVAAAYAAFGPGLFQKAPDGRLSLAAMAMLAPYLIGAWINSRVWTRRSPLPASVTPELMIGRVPSARERAALNIRAIVDLTAELPAPGRAGAYRNVPSLDLVPLHGEALRGAVAAIDALRERGPVLVCCALGYGRSAAAIAAWLIAAGHAADAEQAIATIRRARPRIVLTPEQLRLDDRHG